MSPRTGQFTVVKKDMMDIVTMTQEREVCEELDRLMELGGEEFFL
jgi:hypothetical protein